MSSFLTKLGPLQNLLITAILYNISPSIVTPPTGTDSITVPTLLNGSTITLQSTSSGLQAVTPGNGKPVSISDVFNWNGAQIIVTAQVGVGTWVGRGCSDQRDQLRRAGGAGGPPACAHGAVGAAGWVVQGGGRCALYWVVAGGLTWVPGTPTPGHTGVSRLCPAGS